MTSFICLFISVRICIVENRGAFRRTEQYCPTLEKLGNIDCIVGVDRLDCARRIHKGYAHFGVFSSEDLVGARWASLEILVTNQIKFRKEEFEYDVVVMVDNGANIHSAADLKNSRLCHPGKGLDPTWNDIIGDYMENVMIARGCEKDITLVESRIKATANYFGNSCKAGPWVNDPAQDKILSKTSEFFRKHLIQVFACRVEVSVTVLAVQQQMRHWRQALGASWSTQLHREWSWRGKHEANDYEKCLTFDCAGRVCPT